MPTPRSPNVDKRSDERKQAKEALNLLKLLKS